MRQPEAHAPHPSAADPRVALAIDLGGTQFRVAAVTADGHLLARMAGTTNADDEPEATIRDLAAAVRGVRDAPALGREYAVVGLGVAAPGPLDPTTGIVYQAPNLPRWRHVHLAEQLHRQTGLRAWVGNDANLAAIAEVRWGAGRDAKDLVYLTISTGVGSGFVVDGRLLIGAHGAAGEAGHMAISLDGPLCGCGNRGCLEAYASGTGLVNRAREAISAGRTTPLADHRGELEAVHIAEAAERGDPLAEELIAQAGTALGVGVRNLLHLFNPSIVVIGGGVSRIGSRLWDPMLRVVNTDALTPYRKDLRIVPAELGDDSGLLGAALLAHEAGP